jgi:hypothetical protein
VGSDPPPGLDLLPSGVLSGTAGVEGTFTFTVEVVDHGAPQGRMKRDITVPVAGPARPAGDVTNDSVVTSSDIIFVVEYVFKSGPEPDPMCYGDVNLSGVVTAADIVYLVSYVFKSGPPPLDGCVGMVRPLPDNRATARD